MKTDEQLRILDDSLLVLTSRGFIECTMGGYTGFGLSFQPGDGDVEVSTDEYVYGEDMSNSPGVRLSPERMRELRDFLTACLEKTNESEAQARVKELEDAIREVREDCCVMEPAALRDLFTLLEAK